MSASSARVAIVAGAGGELGRATSEKLVAAGFTVVGVDRSEEGLKDLVMTSYLLLTTQARRSPGQGERHDATGKSCSGALPRPALPGPHALMIVPPDAVTGPGSRRQAGESPGSSDDRSPARSADCKGDLVVKRRHGIQARRVSEGNGV